MPFFSRIEKVKEGSVHRHGICSVIMATFVAYTEDNRWGFCVPLTEYRKGSRILYMCTVYVDDKRFEER